MLKQFVILFVLSSLASGVFAQPAKEQYVVNMTVYEGDTIPYIKIREITILPPKVFKSKREADRFAKLTRKIKKVLPYAKLAKVKLNEIQIAMDTIKNERKRNKFIDQKDKELKAEFEGKLRSFTISEGILLIKLIDRETDNTSYALIQELKGNLTAFMWQTFARMFGSNLKLEYDPNGDDKLIEEIVLRIENGQL